VLEERGDVEAKGMGVMRTWYLTGRRDDRARNPVEHAGVATGR
jgi:adenylate cyclase